MTKSRRVMAVIVAALLIIAMILPGLVVKAEAAEGEKTGETGCDDSMSSSFKMSSISRNEVSSGMFFISCVSK